MVKVDYDARTPEAVQSHTPMQNKKGAAADNSFTTFKAMHQAKLFEARRTNPPRLASNRGKALA